MKPAFAGLLAIAACVVLLGWLIPDEEVRRPMWLFVFLMLAACAKSAGLIPRRLSHLAAGFYTLVWLSRLASLWRHWTFSCMALVVPLSLLILHCPCLLE